MQAYMHAYTQMYDHILKPVKPVPLIAKNCANFQFTGHKAMSVPQLRRIICTTVNGLEPTFGEFQTSSVI